MAFISHLPYPSGYARSSTMYIPPTPDHQMPQPPPPRREIVGITPPRTPFEGRHYQHARVKSLDDFRAHPEPFLEPHRITPPQAMDIDWDGRPLPLARPPSPQAYPRHQEVYPRRTPPPSSLQHRTPLPYPRVEPQYRQHDMYAHPPPPTHPMPMPVSTHRSSPPPPPPVALHYDPPLPMRSPPMPRYRGYPRRAGAGNRPDRRGPVVATSTRDGSHPPRVQRDNRRRQQSRPRHGGSWNRSSGHSLR